MMELHELSIQEAAEGLRAGTFTSAELTEAALARQTKYAETLKPYKLPLPEEARRMAAAADAALAAGYDMGALHGIPLSVKDNFGMSGTPTYCGSPKRLPAKYEVEAPLVSTLRQRQAVIVGKTHTPEFAMCGFALNSHWGTPRNPWDAADHRAPGGSSGGAVVSLLEGSAFLSFGTDSGGSVRIPPSMCGVVGLKPSFGRWTIEGIVPPGPSRDSPGPMARTVADIAYAFPDLDPIADRAGIVRLIEATEIADLRLGMGGDFFWDRCEPGVAEGVKAALDEATRAGARLSAFHFPEAAASFAIYDDGGIGGVETMATICLEMPEWLDTMDPVVSPGYVDSRHMPATEYLGRLRMFDAMAVSADTRLEAVDAVVCPTVQMTPPRISEVSTAAEHAASHMGSMHNVGLANQLHLCGLTIPVALDAAGMPVGLQLLGRRGQEERLIAIGQAFERLLGTPPMVAD